MDIILFDVIIAFLPIESLGVLARLSKWHSEFVRNNLIRIGNTYILHRQSRKFDMFFKRLIHDERNNYIINHFKGCYEPWDVCSTAAKRGNWTVAKSFMDNSTMDAQYQNLILFEAILANQTHIIEKLISDTVDIKIVENFILATLMIKMLYLPLFKPIFIKKRIYLDWPNMEYFIQLAIFRDNIIALKFIIAEKIRFYEEELNRSDILDIISLACEYKREKIIEYWIDNFSNVANDYRVLSKIAKNKNQHLFSKMVDKNNLTGIDVILASIYLDDANYTKELDSASQAMQLPNYGRAIKKAAKVNNHELVKYFIEKGADSDRIYYYYLMNDDQESAWKLRSIYKKDVNKDFPRSYFEYLPKNLWLKAIEYGADIDDAAVRACETGDDQMLDVFIKAGANLNFIASMNLFDFKHRNLPKLFKKGACPRQMFQDALSLHDNYYSLHFILQKFSPKFTQEELNALTIDSCIRRNTSNYLVLSEIMGGKCEHAEGHDTDTC